MNLEPFSSGENLYKYQYHKHLPLIKEEDEAKKNNLNKE